MCCVTVECGAGCVKKNGGSGWGCTLGTGGV